MQLAWIDLFTFLAFFAIVIGISLYKSREEKGETDYFLAGRGLTFWLIGFSLIASNISTEHFVGMAGAGFGEMGLAIASYEWLAAVALVFVALVLLPRFLRCGIYTIPEFLEYRYDSCTRTIMAVYMMIMYVAVALASILYSGALGLSTIFGMDLMLAVWLIGILAGLYTIYGGLKAVVWTDLFQGAALLLGGTLVLVLGLKQVGGLEAFMHANESRMHLILPADHPEIPWTALLLGMWIPHLFYWGLNQFIMQRSLAARSLLEGQRGVLLAAGIKLIMPFIIIFPGIIAWQLYSGQISNGDQAYPTLIREILPTGLRGIMFAALFGAVLSSLDSMLNSASTIFTMDIFKRHLRPDASPGQLVRTGRIMTGAFMLLACLIAPMLANPAFGGIFKYIQMFQGFISPGIVAAFLFGFVFRKAPPLAAKIALYGNIIIYGSLLWLMPELAFLNHMGITFVVIILLMSVVTWLQPLKSSVQLPVNHEIQLESHPSVKLSAAAILVLTALMYVIFW